MHFHRRYTLSFTHSLVNIFLLRQKNFYTKTQNVCTKTHNFIYVRPFFTLKLSPINQLCIFVLNTMYVRANNKGLRLAHTFIIQVKPRLKRMPHMTPIKSCTFVLLCDKSNILNTLLVISLYIIRCLPNVYSRMILIIKIPIRTSYIECVFIRDK